MTPMGGLNTTLAGVTGGVSVGEENRTVTTSPALNPTTRGGGLEAVTDTTPGQHSAPPGKLPSSALQGAHVDALVAARTGLAVPASHATHAAWLTVPSSLLNRPGGHARLGPPAQ